MPTASRKRTARHDRLLRSLADAARVAVITHDNPDPDAIASSWGLVVLIERVLRIPATAVAGGGIIRAENRAMVELLRPPIELVDEFVAEEGTAIVVVDTQFPGLLDCEGACRSCAAVVDHHAHEATGSGGPKSSGASKGSNGAQGKAANGNGRRLRFAYRDIRPRVVASSSMVAGYLKALEIEPDRPLATALLYGIHTDATGWDVKFSRTDRAAIAWLSQFSDPELRGQIERAPIPRSYFESVILALQNTFTYEDAAICFLPSCQSIEVVGEVADQLLRCEGIERVLCGAVRDGRMVFSARTGAAGGNAAHLLERTLRRQGSCGGHIHRAGGFLILKGAGSQQDVESRLRSRWLVACGIAQQRGTRLVAKREILKALE